MCVVSDWFIWLRELYGVLVGLQSAILVCWKIASMVSVCDT